MTSVHSLNFGQTMTANRDNHTTDTLITEEKLYNRRIKVYKHLMISMMLIHLSILLLSVLHLLLRTIYEQTTCNYIIKPATIFTYVIGNGLFLYLYFVLRTNAEFHAKNHEFYDKYDRL